MNQTRIEKKFIFPNQESDLVKKILLVNNFRKLYPDRYITSIYIPVWLIHFYLSQ